MKSNVTQSLLLFPSNKHKKCEMQKHKDSDNINVKCKYCNYAPKFQFVKVSTGVGIAKNPQNFSW
jgi:hypothetical protein